MGEHHRTDRRFQADQTERPDPDPPTDHRYPEDPFFWLHTPDPPADAADMPTDLPDPPAAERRRSRAAEPRKTPAEPRQSRAEPRQSRARTLRTRSRRSRSQTLRSRTTNRGRYYQLPANLIAPPKPAGPGPRPGAGAVAGGAAGAGARHQLARARHNLARAGYRVVRPRNRRPRLPTPIEALLPWGPVLVGIGILIGLMISVFIVPASNVTPEPSDAAVPPATPVPSTRPAPEPQPEELRPRNLSPGLLEVQYSPTPEPPSPTPPPPPPEATLAATYELDEIYRRVFIAEVEIVNESSVAGGWTVELDYGRDVDRLNSFWVDGTPQPELDLAGDRLVFTSTADLPPDSSVALMLHFDRSGFDISPRTCLINGGECVVVDPWWDNDR